MGRRARLAGSPSCSSSERSGVNARPPWGLHQLVPANPARISPVWQVRGSRTAVRSLIVRKLPSNAVIRVRCAGSGCPLATRTLTPATAALDIRRALGVNGLLLRPGQTLEVAITAHAFNGAIARWAIAQGRAPRRTTLCLSLGDTKPRLRC